MVFFRVKRVRYFEQMHKELFKLYLLKGLYVFL